MVIDLEQDAGLHMAQLMPLPLNDSCFSKSRLVIPFWYRLTRVVSDKGLLKVLCVRVCKIPSDLPGLSRDPIFKTSQDDLMKT